MNWYDGLAWLAFARRTSSPGHEKPASAYCRQPTDTLKAHYQYGLTSLMLAATYNSPGVITALLKAGADSNAKDNSGWTLLMEAANNNANAEVITTLLKAGANAKAIGPAGRTAFDCAKDNPKLKGTDDYQKLASAYAQPAAATEGQAASSSELPAKVGPKDTPHDGDPLPLASIRIGGKFDDWNGIRPAFTSGTSSPRNKNLAIDKIYLAVDK